MTTCMTGIAGALSLALMLALAGPAAAQEAQQTQETSKPQGLVDTTGKVRLSLNAGYGFGFDRVDVGTTTSGDAISISGGGGFSFGAGFGYGLSRNLDLDLDLGYQVGGLTPPVENADGWFERGYLLATLKYKIPTSDTGQFKFGAGIGSYFGGMLKFERTDAFGIQQTVEYDPAFGLHLTGEFERFIRSNVSFDLGAKIYFVEYKAKSAKVNSAEVPLSSVKDDVRTLNGSGIDFLIGISVYFE